MGEVLAGGLWKTNAELIQETRRLGYIGDDSRTLDPTYGEGNWWTGWQPRELVCHDLYKLDGVDFRALPHDDGSFDVVTFDPPYAAQGGRETSTMKEYNARYGRDTAPRTPEGVQADIDAGMTEARRVLVQGSGLLYVKCMNYIWSASLWLGAHYTLQHGLALGFEVVDWFAHVGPAPRPQPKNRTRKCASCRGRAEIGGEWCNACGGEGRVPSTQQHARQNVTYLYILRRDLSDAAALPLVDG